MMRNNNETRRMQISQVNQHQGGRFKYMEQVDSASSRRVQIPQLDKENSIRSTNVNRPYLDQAHMKSTSSTHQQTHPKSSTDNLHALRLESQILELQKTLDEQQYEIQTLTEQASHFMKLCDEQKQILIGLNIQGMRSEYQEQVEELLAERQKVQQIIMQLQDDYNEVYVKEESELNAMRERNDDISKQIQQQLQRKKSLLSLVASKDKELVSFQIDLRQSEERIDELRNIQRKLTIALKQLQMLRGDSHRPGGIRSIQTEEDNRKQRQKAYEYSPERKGGSIYQRDPKSSKSKAKYQYEFYKNQ